MPKKLPKPFARPSIEIGGAKREWRIVPWLAILVEDIVPDWGVCVERRIHDDLITLEFAGGKSLMLRIGNTETVFAFVKVDA